MAQPQTLYLRLPAAAPGAALGPLPWLIRAGRHTVDSGRDTLAAVAHRTAGRTVVAIVPGADILVTSVHIPTRQRQRLLQAVPYALEEQLAVDVETQHFAIGPRDAEQRTAVAVVARDRMDAWLAVMSEAGIEPDALVPETLLLPLEEGRWSLLLEGEQVLVRTGACAGYALDPGSAIPLLGAALEQVENTTGLQLYDCEGGVTATELTALAARRALALERTTCPQGALSLLVADAPGPIDLLQGPYGRRARRERLWLPWRGAAVLLALIVLLQISLSVYRFALLRAEARSLDQRTATLFRAALPGTRSVEPRLQVQRRLEALQRSGGGSPFAALIGRAAAPLSSDGGRLRRLHYAAGALEADLVLPDPAALDRLRRRLGGAGLAIQVQNVSARAGAVSARLQLRRATP